MDILLEGYVTLPSYDNTIGGGTYLTLFQDKVAPITATEVILEVKEAVKLKAEDVSTEALQT
jgi:hypothetical protein